MHATRRYAAILAGGSGERFWPLSRRRRPKQLVVLPGSNSSLLSDAVKRLKPIFPTEQTLVVTSRELEASVNEAVPVQVVAEPLRRNTAGALAWLAATLLAEHGEPEGITIAVLTSDHRIEPPDAFRRDIEAALELAEREHAIVTIGVRPLRPDPSYGYLEIDLGETIELHGARAHPVRRFHEKPSPDLAREYAAAPDFLWNSGMFFWPLTVFLDEMARVAPRHLDVIHRLAPLIRDGDVLGAERVFAELPDISIDYLLMERASRIFVVEADFEWDDLGTWGALARYLQTDTRGNSAYGDCVLHHSADCVVYNDAPDVVTCVSGAYNLLVVVTADAVLVCNKDQPESVREVVAALRERGSETL